MSEVQRFNVIGYKDSDGCFVLISDYSTAMHRNEVLISRIEDAFEKLVCITPRNKASEALKQEVMNIIQDTLNPLNRE